MERMPSFTMWNQLRFRMCVMLGQPVVEIEVIVLLAPQHAGQSLAHDARFVFAGGGGRDRGVESVRLLQARGYGRIERGAEGLAAAPLASADVRGGFAG